MGGPVGISFAAGICQKFPIDAPGQNHFFMAHIDDLVEPMIWSSRERNISVWPVSTGSFGFISPPERMFRRKNHRKPEKQIARKGRLQRRCLAKTFRENPTISPLCQYLTGTSRTTDYFVRIKQNKRAEQEEQRITIGYYHM